MRRILPALVALSCIALMGANTIDILSFTSPKANQLDGNGTYTVDNKMLRVSFFATETSRTPNQTSSAQANAACEVWDGTLNVVAGTYDGFATLLYLEADNKTVKILTSNKILDVKVSN